MAEQTEGHAHSSAPFHTAHKQSSHRSPPSPPTLCFVLTRFWMSALLARSKSSITFFSALTASLSSSFCHCGITAVASVCKTGVGRESQRYRCLWQGMLHCTHEPPLLSGNRLP